MPRHEEAGLLNTKSMSSDLSTSTMKSDPGGPASVPGLGPTLVVPSSACAAAVEGRLTKAAVWSASAALACLTAGIAVAAPATAAPARNLCGSNGQSVPNSTCSQPKKSMPQRVPEAEPLIAVSAKNILK